MTLCIMAQVCWCPFVPCGKRQPNYAGNRNMAGASTATSDTVVTPLAIVSKRRHSRATGETPLSSACHRPVGMPMTTHKTGGPSLCASASSGRRPDRGTTAAGSPGTNTSASCMTHADTWRPACSEENASDTGLSLKYSNACKRNCIPST